MVNTKGYVCNCAYFRSGCGSDDVRCVDGNCVAKVIVLLMAVLFLVEV